MVRYSPLQLRHGVFHQRRDERLAQFKSRNCCTCADGFTDIGKGPGSSEGKYINWHTITDNPKSVVEDVSRIRNHPLVPKNIPIYGYIYDVTTGQLIEIADATKAGKAS